MLKCDVCGEQFTAVLLTSRVPCRLECTGVCQRCLDARRSAHDGGTPGVVVDAFPASELAECFRDAEREVYRR